MNIEKYNILIPFKILYAHSIKLVNAISLPSIASSEEFADPKSNEKQEIKSIDKYNDPNMLLPHIVAILNL